MKLPEKFESLIGVYLLSVMSANVYKACISWQLKPLAMNDFIEKPLDKQDIEAKLLKLINQEFKVTGRILRITYY